MRTVFFAPTESLLADDKKPQTEKDEILTFVARTISPANAEELTFNLESHIPKPLPGIILVGKEVLPSGGHVDEKKIEWSSPRNHFFKREQVVKGSFSLASLVFGADIGAYSNNAFAVAIDNLQVGVISAKLLHSKVNEALKEKSGQVPHKVVYRAWRAEPLYIAARSSGVTADFNTNIKEIVEQVRSQINKRKAEKKNPETGPTLIERLNVQIKVKGEIKTIEVAVDYAGPTFIAYQAKPVVNEWRVPDVPNEPRRNTRASRKTSKVDFRTCTFKVVDRNRLTGRCA